jgi:pyruvate dehydrogenase E2 component (dihydrolipoamide acetyltransferase)
MPFEIVLPSLSAGMEDAIIARWLKGEGDPVSKGDIIAEIETDKATMELAAEANGRIGKLLISNGERAEVNQVIAIVLGESEDASQFTASEPPAPARPTDHDGSVGATGDQVPAQSTPTAAALVTPEVRHKASPLARRIAREQGIALAGVAGTGPKARIVRADVEKAALSRVAVVSPEVVQAMRKPQAKAMPVGIGDYEALPHSSMRRTIARRLLEAKTTVPHFYLNMDCDVEALLLLRSQINGTREKALRISVNDFVIKAAAVALRKVPDANVIWTEDALLRLSNVDIAVAVATDGGLITPIVRNADQMSIGEISSLMKSLAARARASRLKPEEFQGGGFSISNLGMYGVKSFSAIINPPQSAILAVGATERRAIERVGAVAFSTVMSVTLSVDHRAVDGAIGAQWLAAFKAAVESPVSLFW